MTKNVKIQSKDAFEIDLLVESTDIVAENIPLDIIYEDDSILVINKEP